MSLAIAHPFGLELRRARKASRVGLRPLAGRVGMSHVYLYEIEIGVRWAPSPALVSALAMELGADHHTFAALALISRPIRLDLRDMDRAACLDLAKRLDGLVSFPDG